jgi:predicted nucleotide-binding protein
VPDSTLVRLNKLRSDLEALEPYPWENVEAWRAKARPFFREALPKHFDDFEATTETPKWVMMPLWSSGGNRWTGEGPRNNFAEAAAEENRSNRRIAAEQKRQILAWLEGIAEQLPHANSSNPLRNAGTEEQSVFLVHGHNGEAKERTARFLEQLGLNVVILHEQPDGGRTIIEKFEHYSAVKFAVILLTADDVGSAKSDPSVLKPRGRQNVVFEHGYFIGALGRKYVCALREEGVEVPSDLSGILYVPIDSGDTWKLALAKELRASGLDVDLNRAVPC